MRILSLLTFICLFAACSPKIYPDRTQFIKDGDFVPTIKLETYKSVQERPFQDADLAVALCISGGGSRAANFGIGIMLGLEELISTTNHTMLQEVDYISTVSGGGFAGGAYISTLYDHQFFAKDTRFSLSFCLEDCIRTELKHSYTGTLISANFNPRLWFSYSDDGDALEKAIDDLVLGHKRRKQFIQTQKSSLINRSITLGDLFVPKDSKNPVLYPMFFANGSLLEKMAIIPFAPDILQRYQINGYVHRLKRYRNQPNVYEMPLAIGIKASGSFPSLISSSTLESDYNKERKYLHVIDGAMTDNSGAYTAYDVLKQDQAKTKILLVVDADKAGNRPTFSKKQAAPFSVGVYTRLASSGLDARRLLLEKELTDLQEATNITPVFFSFNILIRNNEAVPPKKIKVKAERARLMDLLRNDMANISDLDLQILYELVTTIGTKYTITEVEQELLLLTAKKIVLLQKDNILSALQRK